MDIERFLLEYPDAIRTLTHTLRTMVLEAVPEAIERLRPGWRLIGYDVPIDRRMRYFAYVAPEPEHVHLGFEHGTLVSDPEALLQGAHLGLRKVRYLTFRPSDAIPASSVQELIERAASVALLGAADRAALADELARER